MGEGWGEGEKYGISLTYIPIPLIPSRQGRGIETFYETIDVGIGKREIVLTRLTGIHTKTPKRGILK